MSTSLTTTCIQFLKLAGCFCWRNNTGQRGGLKWGKKGSGDIFGIMPDGRFLSVECKRKGDKPNEDQVKFAEEVNRQGGLAITVWSLDELIEKLGVKFEVT